MKTADLLVRNGSLNNKHDHQCPDCNHAPFENAKGLAMHRGRVHERSISVPHQRLSKQVFKCQQCDKSFKNQHGVGIHTARMHSVPKRVKRAPARELIVTALSCPICNCDWQPLRGLNKSMQLCPHCGLDIPLLISNLRATVKHSAAFRINP